MHAPYQADDPKVSEAIDLLGHDPLVIDRVQHHDPSFGYSTTAGYIEEDSVQALEQIVSEKFGVGRNACQYWQKQDGGMHVLAAAVYTDYKQATSSNPEPYSQWFVRAVQDGQLRGSNLRKTVESFFSSAQCISPAQPRFMIAISTLFESIRKRTNAAIAQTLANPSSAYKFGWLQALRKLLKPSVPISLRHFQ
jgi:hypothetical protein